MRPVTVQDGDKATDNIAGGLIGGIIGALGGNMIGQGHGNTAATVGGALLGALAGSQIQKTSSQQEAYEYTVKLINGQIVTVVQSLDNPMYVGQRVFVQSTGQGRSRVIPDNTPSSQNYKNDSKNIKEFSPSRNPKVEKTELKEKPRVQNVEEIVQEYNESQQKSSPKIQILGATVST